MEGYARTHNTAVFIIIEPVDGAGAGRLLVGVLPIRLYRLRRTNIPICLPLTTGSILMTPAVGKPPLALGANSFKGAIELT